MTEQEAARLAELEAQNAELLADKKAGEVKQENERKTKRAAVLEKHAKRLSPATMKEMSASLEAISDPAKVDEILSKIPDEVAARRQGKPETAYPQAGAASGGVTSKGEKWDDPEGELIRLATKKVDKSKKKAAKGKGAAMSFASAVQEICRENPELHKAVTKQRAGYPIPRNEPPDSAPTTEPLAEE